jgi:gliding motility-associated-like protein
MFSNPTLALVSTGNNIICEGEEVKIEVDTTQSLDFDYYVYYWCDGKVDTAGSIGRHTYRITLDEDDVCDFGETSFFVQVLGVKECGDGKFTSRTTGTSQGIKYKPRARFTAANETCITESVRFTNQSCFGTSYLWDFGDGITSEEENPSHTYATPRNYTVRLTTRNDCDVSVITKTISIVGEPKAEFFYSPNDPTALCGSPTVDIINQSNQWSRIQWNIQPMDTLKWRFTDTLMSLFSDSLRIHFFQPGDYIVTLTARNACPEDVKVDTISINERPVIDLVTPSVSCDEQVLSSSDILRSSSGAITKYVWTFENASVDRIEGETFSNVRFTRSGKATLTIESPCGNQSRTVDIAVASTAPIFFESDLKQVCQNDSIRQLRVQPLGGLWEGLGAATNAISTDGKLNPSLLAEGTYVLKYSTGSAQCPNEKLDTFSILPAVGVTLAGVAPVCNELSLNTATITTYAGAIDRYEWRYNGTVLATSNFPMLSFSPGSGALIVTADGTCGVASDTISIQVQKDTVINIMSVNNPICAGSSPIQLQADVAEGAWRGMGITDSLMGIFDPSQVMPDQIYTITYGFVSGACNSRASVDIRVIASQSATIEDKIICTDSEPIQLAVNTTIAGTWGGQGIIDSINGTFSPNGLQTNKNYPVTFTFTDSNNCVVSTNGEVLVEALPVLNKLDTIQLCLSNIELDLPSLVNYNPTPMGGTSRWRGEGIRNTSGKFNPVASNLTEGFYKIFVEYERNDCMVMDSVVVELIQARPLVLSPDTTVCISAGQLQLATNLAGGSWRPSNNINSTGLINLAQLGGGNFTFNYEYQVGTSCEQRAQVNVEVIDLRSTVNAGSDISVCQASGTVTFVGTPALNGIWSANDAMNPTTGVVNVNQLAPGTYECSYQIESETVAGCVAEDRVSLTVHALPVPAFEVSGSLCVNTLLAFNNRTNGAATYRWDFGIGSRNEANPNFTFPTAGDYNIVLTAFTNTTPQCSATTNQMIRISEPPPAVGFRMDKREGCADLEVTFTNTSQGENLALTWNFGNGQSSSENQPPAITYGQGRTDTTYYIQIVAGNNCGDRIFQDSVLVHPQPVARLGTDRAKYCSGDTTLLINASFGQPDRYRWTYGNGQSSNDSIPIRPIYYTDSLSRSYLITLFAENECGVDTDSFNIRIDPTNVTAFYRVDSTVFCAGDSVRLESFSTPFSRLFWDFGDGNSSTIARPIYVYNRPGTYQIVHYAFGCGSDSMVQQITIKPTPVPAFDIMGSRCVGDTIRLVNRSNDAVSFAWRWGDGTSSNFSQATHRYLMNGNYEITLTATAENRCSASLTRPITIRALPVFQMNAPDSVCANAPTAITVTANELFSSYNWQFGDGEVANGRLVTHRYLTSDTYTLSVLITDAFGCKSSQETSIFVRPTPTAAFSYELLRNCPPVNGFFFNESQTANGFGWKFSDNFTATTVDVERIFEQDGTFTAELIASYDGICFDTTQQTLTINATPQVQLEVQDISCFGENDGAILVSNNLGHRINVSGENYQQSGDNLFEALRPGTYKVEVVSRERCDTLYQVEIFEPDSLFVDILKDTIFLVIGERAIIQVNANKSGLNYNWFPDSITFSGGENNFTGSPRLSGWYKLTASDGTCTAMDRVFFLVAQLPAIYPPTHFSPNGDNNNDIFYPQTGTSVARIESLQIFDRWGDLVFAAYDFPPNDPNFGWDGTYKGRPLNPAVFVCKTVFRLKDGSTTIRYSDITLVR